ncbi:GT-D fold domain-containing glycosyltransferase [Paenibacillus thalictri]|uniref:GT-D fold-like domain-containing protein n=1 Tax=Paenibacillus thalictri TaxID=2527873 RepID=A0A4Q9DQC9_9BACL|nr:GT-D fold domain-containing glycosyltransferase [Paenibacillus thalictri]TBL78636.1 hypothetical protein EYB31_14150 [Paenibacillus thalictri]
MEESKMLSSGELMDKILEALRCKQPLSVVSVGATESFVMAQYTLMPEEEFMKHSEAVIANKGEKSGFLHRGVRFPNVQLRDEVVEAVRQADIIGYNTLIRFKDAGRLTERVFNAYGIQPKYIYEAYLRRVIMFSQKDKFDQMLAGRKVLLIGSPAQQVRDTLNKTRKHALGFEIVGTVAIDEYEDVPEAKNQIDRYEFDLCLLAAGTNALILSAYISKVHGKVAFDLGSGLNSLHTDVIYSDYWLDHLIGINKLRGM